MSKAQEINFEDMAFNILKGRWSRLYFIGVSLVAILIQFAYFAYIGMQKGLPDNYALTFQDSMIVMAVILTCWVATIRRLHDLGYSGKYALLFLIGIIPNPVIYVLCLIGSAYLTLMPSQKGENHWGETNKSRI